MTTYQGRAVLVAGTGIAGTACAKVLLGLGAEVTVINRSASAALTELAELGARPVVAHVPDPGVLRHVSDVVVSPGFAPDH
ncbi:MAG: hypothetical protein ACRDUA_14400, partial [Micromonosporaceae bacterium]